MKKLQNPNAARAVARIGEDVGAVKAFGGRNGQDALPPIETVKWPSKDSPTGYRTRPVGIAFKDSFGEWIMLERTCTNGAITQRRATSREISDRLLPVG